MKLSAAFVIEQLRKSYRISAPHELSTKPHLINPAIYLAGMKFNDSIVYIINEGELNTFEVQGKFPVNSLLIIIGGQVNHMYPNSCTLHDTLDEIAVFSLLHNLFELYATWKENSINAYLEGKSIQDILTISLPLLENSLTIVGMDFSILATAKIDNQNSNEYIFGSSQDTHSYITALKNNNLYNDVKNLKEAFYFPIEVTGLASLCVNIRHNEETTYRLLMLEDNRKIGKSEGFILEFLALLIQRMLYPSMIKHSNQASDDSKRLTEIFLNILDDKNPDYQDIYHSFSDKGWFHDHKYTCIYIKLTEMDKRSYTYYPIISYFNNVFTNACPFLYKDNIVVFINMTLSQLSMDEFIKHINGFAKESLLDVGISRSLPGFIYYKYQYKQAQIALSIGIEKSPKNQVHFFNHISFDYILQQSTEELPASMIVEEKLVDLVIIDKTDNTEYMKTLRTYYNNYCNKSQTAKELFIHRSTLVYRLDKIKEILGLDLVDPDEVLYLILSLRLLNY